MDTGLVSVVYGVYGVCVVYVVSICVPALVGTKLYCLVIRARGCEQLAQSCYPAVHRPRIELQPLDHKSNILPLCQPAKQENQLDSQLSHVDLENG